MKRLTPLLLSFCPLLAMAEDPAGKVLLSLGSNTAVNQQGESRPLVRTNPFYSGDTLVTDTSGRLQLRLSDGALVALDPDSRFRVADYVFADAAGDRAIFELVRGGIRTLSGKISPESGGEYGVRTVVATIGIRGTHYALQLCLEGCAGEAGRREGLAGLVLDGTIVVDSSVRQQDVPAGRYFFVDKASGEIESSHQPPAEFTAPSSTSGLPQEGLFDPTTRPSLDRLPSGLGSPDTTSPSGIGNTPGNTPGYTPGNGYGTGGI